MIKKFLVLLICLYSALALADDMPPFDIGGIKLSADYDSAKLQAHQINPNFSISLIRSVDSLERGFVARAPSTSPSSDELVVEALTTGKIWYIGRSRQLPQGDRIEEGKFLQTIYQKYGKPSYNEFNSKLSLVWVYDRDGQNYKSEGQRICDTTITASNIVPGARSVAVPASFREKCGKTIRIIAGATDGLVNSYTILIADNAAMYDELERADKKAKAERYNAIEREKSKDNKPSL